MTFPNVMAFAPEGVLLLGSLVLFVISLGDSRTILARRVSLATAIAATAAALLAFGQEGTLFDGAYRVDLFSQLLKLVLCAGFALIVLLGDDLPDIDANLRGEYHLLVALSVSGLVMLVSCIELLTLVVALELSAFPLYFLVAMRRERPGQRAQMEAAIKYIMFGIAANGVMLFGLSYLFGLTGTTSLPEMLTRLQPLMGTPLAIAGLSLTFCGLFYKLAIFPFHFWTPDVYEGASNETAGLVASLPKVAMVAVLVRFTAMAGPESQVVALLLAVLAAASMFYGNFIALVQTDFKRLLGFSGIAHAGYALIGFVSLDQAGFTAALYYIVGYLVMVLGCFVVICRVSHDGFNLSVTQLAGLHRRSPLLAVTLIVCVFGLAGIPPFAGFMGKLTLLKAALAKGYLWLVVVAVINTAIAIYYYLGLIRETCFQESVDQPALRIDWPTRFLCVVLVAATLALGVFPSRFLDTASSSLTAVLNPATPSGVSGAP